VVKNVVPIITCSPWKPVATKKVDPYAESTIVNGASRYSYAESAIVNGASKYSYAESAIVNGASRYSYAESAIVNGASMYSYACSAVKYSPNRTVKSSPCVA
jgi:hypothetical protein